MKFKYKLGIFWRVLVQFITMLLLSYLLIDGEYLLALFLTPVIIFEINYFYRFHYNTQKEIQQFVESIQFRDFSRHFNIKKAPYGLKTLRRGLNEINSAFITISTEKETQYQYLQKLLELVDTGILSYKVDSGEIVWMNESLKKILDLPYLKTVNSLEKRDPVLYTQIMELAPAERVITNINSGKTTIKVVLSTTSFKTGNQSYKLVVFQNVNEALDETESKAWQKLLSVMTHEIMNSVAPISSLANTLQKRMRDLPVDSTLREDLELGIGTIKNRSEGLLKFTQTYRNLNKITSATLVQVQVSELFGNIYRLMQPNLNQRNIDVEIILPEPLLYQA
jgi:nitrogen fixation/metabolism regulation signal transduction histidine kinase